MQKEYFILTIKPYKKEHFEVVKKYNFKENKYYDNYIKISSSKEEAEKFYKEFLYSDIGFNYISSNEFKY